MTSIAPRDTGRSAAIDALRALAAIAVLLTHTGDAAGTQATTTHVFGMNLATGRAIYELNIGVGIFFVISGYLVYRPFVAAHFLGSAPPGAGRFWWRRFLRVYPAYWAAVTVIVVLFASRTMPSVRAAIAHYSLTYTYVPKTVASDIGLRQSWTLVMEVSFYVLVPLWATAARGIARVAGTRGAEYGGASALVAAGPAMMVVIHRTGWAYTGIAPFLGLFGAGMLLAVASADAPVARWCARRSRRLAPWWLTAIAVYVVFIALVHIPPGGVDITYHQQIAERVVNAVVGFLLVAPLAFAPHGTSRAWRPLAFVGVVSYGFYLWHYAVLDALHDHVITGAGWRPFTALFVASAVGAGGLGVASWFAIERPALRASRRASTHATALPASAASPTSAGTRRRDAP